MRAAEARAALTGQAPPSADPIAQAIAADHAELAKAAGHSTVEWNAPNATADNAVALPETPAPTAPSAGEARQPPAAEPLPAATEVPGAPPLHDYMAEYEANQARTEDAEPPPEPTVDTTFQQRRGEQLANEEAQEEEVLRQHVIDVRRRENEAAVAAAHEQWATPNKIVPSFLRPVPLPNAIPESLRSAEERDGSPTQTHSTPSGGRRFLAY